jgi:CNT family concentrative nucleoside transporter
MGVSGVEALSTGAEVFLGQVESQLLVKNYIKNVTPSELLGIMAAAMATISGSALVAYVGLGINPTYLLMASFMTAPSALVVAKIMIPETDMEALDRDADLTADETPSANWRIQDIVGFFFTPVAWLMGIPWDEAVRVGPLLGTKTVLNEFIAYIDLAKMSSGPGALSPVTVMVTTIALCGFANLGSIGINIGGLSKMAPERKSDIAKMGFKALMAATIASWMTAAIARLVM